MQILIWIVSGIIAGWLTGLIMRGHGFGLIADLVIGLLGGSEPTFFQPSATGFSV